MFDAGSVAASLTIDTSKFDSDLDKAEARVKAFEDSGHKVKLSAVFDTSSISRARQQFAQLDQTISKDAMSRLRSSPQGSVLGALNALFSPHQVTGAPSPQQAAQQGLLGKMLSAPGGGGTAGPVSGNGQSNVISRVLGTNTPSGGTISTTDRVNTVGLPTNNTISTTDTVNQRVIPARDPVTGRFIGADTTTTETVKEKLDPASAAKTEGDARASGDRSGTGWATWFAAHLKNLFSPSAASTTEKAAKSSGDRSGSGFFAGFSMHAGPFFAGFVKGFGDAGKSGGNALDKGLLGGIGPGIAGVSTKISAIVGGVGSALGALPALAGIAGTGAGVALVGGIVAVVSKGAISAVQPAVQAFQALQNAAPGKAQVAALAAYRQQLALLTPAQQGLAKSLEGAQAAWQNFVKSNTAGVAAIVSGGLGLLPGILSQMSGIFQAVVPQMESVWRSLGGVVQGVLGVARTAVPAFAPFVNAVLGLVTNILPGVDVVIKATLPFISQFAQVLGGLGKDLGGFFATAAPAIGASMQILSSLLGLVGGLLPIVVKVADVFATSLAPVFTQFAGVIQKLLPPLVQIGGVIASFAGAVIGDLAAAFGAIATLIGNLAPSLAILAKTLTSVFTIMENAGVFAIFGDALENLAVPLANLINALVTGLAPILPVLVSAASQLSTIMIGALSAALGAVLTALTPVISILARGVVAVTDFLQSTGLLLPVMAALALTFGPVATGLKAAAAGMAAFAGSGFVAAIVGMVDVVTAFTEATVGLTVAQKALVATSLALDAVSPLAWAVIGAAALTALTVALIRTSAASTTIVGEFQQQQAALNYNITAYKQLAATVETASQGYAKFAKANSDAVRGGAGAITLANQLHQLAQGMSASAVTILQRVADLSQGLGVSKTVIEQWATAAGISAPKLGSAAENTGLLTQQIVAFVNKNAQAITATSSLGTNVAIFGNDVFNATTQLDAFNGIWNTLVGNLLTKQMAVTNSNAAFDNLSQTIKQGGANSDSAKQSFQQYIALIGSSASALEKGGASVATINSYLQGQIDHIETLGPLNKSEQADLAGLKAAQDAYANSTNGLNAQQKTLISQFETGLIPSLQQMNADTPKVTGDISNLTNAIIQTGAHSAATAGDRAKLIADLEQAGVKASVATGFVNGLQGKIDALKGKVVAVDVHGTGSGSITATENILGEKTQKLGSLTFVARGGMITGGTPGKDSVLGMLMPGEVVVPAAMVTAGAVDHLRGMLPGFAAGGLLSGSGQDYEGTSGSTFLRGASNAGTGPLLNAFLAAASTAAVKAITVAQQGNPQAGPGGGSPAANYALAQALYPAYKGTAVMAAWNYVAMRESGWNQFARNPSSGAYGIPQALPESKLPFAGQAAGGSNPSAQIQWMWDYMASTYGGPIGAAQHEAAFNWYGNGGMISEPVLGRGLNSGRGYVLGERGSEMVTPVGGMRGGDPTTTEIRDLLRQLHADNQQLIQVGKQAPAATGQHIGAAIGGAAHDASFRSRYPRSN